MTSKNAKIGYRFECRTRNYLRDHGYYVIRAYASKGIYDLIGVPSIAASSYKYPKIPLLVQCKKNGYVPPKERQRLKDNDKWNGITVIAFSHPKTRRMTFRNLQGIEYEL